MKHLILILFLSSGLSAIVNAQTNSLNDKHDTKIGAQKKTESPAISRSVSQLASSYYRDANNVLIQEDNINTMPVEHSSSYSKMLDRTKRFPENVIKEKLYRNNKSEEIHLRNIADKSQRNYQ